MKASRAMAPCWCAVGTVALAASLASCGLVPASRAGPAETMTLPSAGSSVLVVITDQGSSTAMKITSTLLGETARTGERIIILGERGRAVLASSTAPAPPSLRAPESPTPLPPIRPASRRRGTGRRSGIIRKNFNGRGNRCRTASTQSWFPGRRVLPPRPIPPRGSSIRAVRTSPLPWAKRPRTFPACGSPVAAPPLARPLPSSGRPSHRAVRAAGAGEPAGQHGGRR